MPYATSNALYGRREDLAGALYSTSPAMGFAALRILPALPVGAKDGRYPKISNALAYRIIKTKRAADGSFARGSTPVTSGTFLCEERGFEEPVDRVNKALYRGMFDQELVAAETARNVVAIDHEADVAAAIYNETTFPATGTTGLTVSTPWSTAATATPIADVNTGKNAIAAKVGNGKFALLANDKVLRNIWKTTDVREAMKYQYGGVIPGTPDYRILAVVLGVDEIIDAPAMYNSAVGGAAASMSRIWSDTYAFLARIDTDRQLRAPQLGRTFVYNDVFDRAREATLVGNDQIDDRLYVEMYPDDQRDADIVRAREFTDEVIMDSSCGFLYKTVT